MHAGLLGFGGVILSMIPYTPLPRWLAKDLFALAFQEETAELLLGDDRMRFFSLFFFGAVTAFAYGGHCLLENPKQGHVFMRLWLIEKCLVTGLFLHTLLIGR